MTPREITSELDKHIIGQDKAKRAVAIALRNRWRRMKLDDAMRVEITPKNILMIGPTGVGKTEIARRLARLAQAPFIKVEATKFTEVGYVGRDVESIIRDLADVSVKMTREVEIQKVRHLAEDLAEERILDVLLPQARVEEKEETAKILNKIGKNIVIVNCKKKIISFKNVLNIFLKFYHLQVTPFRLQLFLFQFLKSYLLLKYCLHLI